MKLFQLKTTGAARPDYYIAAHTNIEALATLFMDCELSFDDLDYEDKMIEIPEREWDELKLKDKMKGLKYSEVVGYGMQD